MAALDWVENGLCHFDDGTTLPLPPGVSAEWVGDPWYAGWQFRTPAGRAGKALPVVITQDTALPARPLVEKAMAWLAEQESVRGATG